MLDRIVIDEAVRGLRPDVTVLAMTAKGLGVRLAGLSPVDGPHAPPATGADSGTHRSSVDGPDDARPRPPLALPSVDGLARADSLDARGWPLLATGADSETHRSSVDRPHGARPRPPLATGALSSVDGQARAERALPPLSAGVDSETLPSDALTREWLAAAAKVADLDDPHLEAWRDAYRAFGAKPQRTRPSVDALLRRVDDLPTINRVVDTYNAISVQYVLPVGGEDLDAYRGPARLIRATGDEPFDTVAGGEPVTETPVPGEVVWRDDEGVTCRRWNWRQCVRTRITEDTVNALFLLERLAPYPLARLHEAADDLAVRLRMLSPDVRVETRLIGAD